MEILSRQSEIAILQQMLDSNMPEFLALYGRRRVGKTYLIKRFFQDKDVIFFNTTGLKDGSMKEQILNFTQRMGEEFFGGVTPKPEYDWNKTFGLLNKAINSADKNKKIVLFFDELPWMATKRSKLLQRLDYYWNQYWSDNPQIKLIVCGSSASWILNNIIRNKGGLYNRITREIHLEPLTLPETKEYLSKLGVKLDNKQIMFLYMAIGGIPYYLNRVEKGLTAMQIIERLAFAKKAFLLEEFKQLFRSLFDDDNGAYTEIIKIIAKSRYGIGQQQLLNELGTNARGGFYTRKLKQLEESGFIMSFTPIYHKRQGIYYRIVDEYTLFYLKWIDPINKSLQKQAMTRGNWESIQNTPELNNWLGYAFESVCYKHLPVIREKLQINPSAIANSWRYVPKKGSKQQGAQIDLLFDTRDDAITLCEIKYSQKPYSIDKSYAEVLRRKMEVFKKQTRTNKQLFICLIAANGISKNSYSDELISNFATIDDLFDKRS